VDHGRNRDIWEIQFFHCRIQYRRGVGSASVSEEMVISSELPPHRRELASRGIEI